jgi:hypothetical protein
MAYTTTQWKDAFLRWTEGRMEGRLVTQHPAALQLLAQAAEGAADAQASLHGWYTITASTTALEPIERDLYEKGMLCMPVVLEVLHTISAQLPDQEAVRNLLDFYRSAYPQELGPEPE